MIAQQEEQPPPISMRDIKLSEEEKRRLMLVGTVILVMFAVSILITEAIIGAAHPYRTTTYYPGNCGNLTNGQNPDTCLIDYANSTENASVCSYINDENKNVCYMGVALKTQSLATCGHISKTDALYSQCLLNLNRQYRSITLCNNVSLSDEQGCVYNVSAAYNFSAAQMCNKLTNATYEVECTNLNYYRRAESTGDYKLCANLQSTRNATTLYFISANRTNATQSLLDVFYSSSLNMSPQEYCYVNSAVSLRNASICRYTAGQIASGCVSAVEQYNASTIPVNLSAPSLAAACGSYTGYSLNICSSKYLSHSALINKNVTYCSLINSSTEANECILNLALNTSNSSYCSKITNTSIMGLCNLIRNYSKSGPGS